MATRNLLAALDNKLVQVAVTSARPAIAGDGVDITSWRTGIIFSAQLAAILVDGDQAMTIDSPTGGTKGVELWGYRLAQWWRVGYLNNGTVIDIVGNLQGYAAEARVIGIFDRLSVAGTVSGGAAIAKILPIESWS